MVSQIFTVITIPSNAAANPNLLKLRITVWSRSLKQNQAQTGCEENSYAAACRKVVGEENKCAVRKRRSACRWESCLEEWCCIRRGRRSAVNERMTVHRGITWNKLGTTEILICLSFRALIWRMGMWMMMMGFWRICCRDLLRDNAEPAIANVKYLKTSSSAPFSEQLCWQGVTYGVNRLQKCIPKDIKWQIPPGLDSTVGEPISHLGIP